MRMPCDAYSLQADLAMPTTACFEAVYAGERGMPVYPAIEAMLTMEPRCRRRGFSGLRS